jgi:hypothetical protein
LSKIIQPFLLRVFINVLGDHLLCAGPVIALIWAQFTSTMGAQTFLQYLITYELLLILTIFEHLICI